eukprot:TRINITY_DN3950_c0_g2_i1.p1 TRINITY_DN3950_c0_g2~~TRINITY_DN3950_c0_g2_i1.p1  ORF type:complete len:861 (+),score=271.67 TRINITY_DN3950_c0_g2_i1:208-2790(+)
MSYSPWDSSTPVWARSLGCLMLVVWVLLGLVFFNASPEIFHAKGSHLYPIGDAAAQRHYVESQYWLTLQEADRYLALVVTSPIDIHANDALQRYADWLTANTLEYVMQADGSAIGTYVESYFRGFGNHNDKDLLLSMNNRSTVFFPMARVEERVAKEYANHLKYDLGQPERIIVNYNELGNYRGVVADHILDAVPPNGTITGDKLGYACGVTGGIMMKAEAGDPLESMTKMEVVVLPIAFCVLLYFLRSLRMLTIPFVGIVLSLGGSYAAAMPVAAKWGLTSSVTEVMASLCVALSIDASLFLLTRFNESRDNGMGVWEATLDMTIHTGHTVLVSGVLVCMSFLSGVILPVPPLRVASVCTGIAAAVTVFTNLAVTPALLAIFGNWITKPLPFSLLPASCKKEAPREEDTAWFRLACHVARNPRRTTVVAMLIGLPFMVAVPFLNISMNRNYGLPISDSMRVGWELEQHGIAPGLLTVNYIALQVLEPNATVYDPEAFDVLHKVGDAVFESFDGIAEPGRVNPKLVWSIAYFDGKKVDLAYRQSMQEGAQGYRYRVAEEEWVNFETSTLLLIYVPFELQSAHGGKWYPAIRDRLSAINHEVEGKYRLHLNCRSATEHDVAHILSNMTPVVVSLVMVCVMVFVGVVFRSAVLPFRLAFALLYTVLVTLGIAVVAFQTKALWWAIPDLELFENDGLAFTVPAVVLPVCIALGLDYDIFLLTRVEELRMQGYSDVEAVILGVARTGPTISGAAVIMVIAFSGLLFAPEMTLKQFGLILSVSVLLDAFVIRTILVPALMVSAAQRNWWPRNMPDITKALFTDPVERALYKLPPLDRITQTEMADLNSELMDVDERDTDHVDLLE